jgi:hypothetical protein
MNEGDIPLIEKICPYPGCSLNCVNKQSHKAKYAAIKARKQKSSNETDKTKVKERSPKVNWERLKKYTKIYNLIMFKK